METQGLTDYSGVLLKILYDIKEKHLNPPEQRFGGVIFLLEAWHFDLTEVDIFPSSVKLRVLLVQGGFDSRAKE